MTYVDVLVRYWWNCLGLKRSVNILSSDNLIVVDGRPSVNLALANCHLASDLPFFLEFLPQVTIPSEIVTLRNLSIVTNINRFSI